jgi:hypothetical protein
MTAARTAPWAIAALFLASFLAALPAAAQNWPSNPPAAGPGQFPPANAPAPAAAGPGQFPPANAPTMLPAQPGAVPPPSQWGNAAPQHPAWGGGGAQRQGPPCAEEMMPLRNDAQTKGVAIKAAVDRKADRSEICKVFRIFIAAEAKFVKFAQDNGSRCSVPADAVKVMKDNHSKSVTMSNRVCNAAAGPGGAAPAPPSLSDALGTARVPDPSNIKKGGTFDTLSGSPLAR